MNKPTFIVACAAAFIGMGIAMPQCPGEKAMQEQIDGLRQSQQAMTSKLINLDGQNRSLQGELAQSKQLITQLASAVTAQSDAMGRMDTALKDMQTKVASLAKRPASRKSKPRKKHH